MSPRRPSPGVPPLDTLRTMFIIAIISDVLLKLAPQTFIRLAPQSWLVNLCHRLASARRINSSTWGDPVIRISDGIVVKYGAGIFPGEAATQEYAYQHVNPKIVRVPRVYRYFQHHVSSEPAWQQKGYLFMEYIPGQNLKSMNNLDSSSEITKRLTEIIIHLGQIKGSGIPGPVGGGVPRGYLWGEDGPKHEFRSLHEVNVWVNSRLGLLEKPIDLTPHPLNLCHMDLCRRNIILMRNNSICLLDWGHAGFFPRFYEMAAIRCNNDHYSTPLSEAVKGAMPLTDDETRCMDLIIRARAASMQWFLDWHTHGTYLPL